MIRFSILTIILLVPLAAPAQAAWVEQHSIWGNGNTFSGVSAGSGLVAAVAGAISDGQGSSKAAIFYTKDGGQTWNETGMSGQFEFLLFLDLANEKVGYGGGLGFFSTADGGQSWSSVTLPGAGFMTTVTAVQALDPAKVFVGMENKVVRTQNSINWEVTDTGIDFGILDLHFIDKDTGWVAGGTVDEEEDPYNQGETIKTVVAHGTLLHTTDGGLSFAPLIGGANEVYTGVSFVSQNIGLLVGHDADFHHFLRRTTDGGQTWGDVELPPHPSGKEIISLSAPEMINMGQGWMVGGAGVEEGGMGNSPVFLRTWDGGLSWEHDDSYDGTGGTLLSVSFHDEHRGWACGDGGLIVAWNDGTAYIPPEPDADVGPGQDAGPEEDVWTWGNVLGSFDDEGKVGAGQSTGPGPHDPLGDVDPGGDPGDPSCETITETTGGCAATQVPMAGGGLLLLLALGLIPLALRRRPPTVLLLALAVLAASCDGETTTRTVCEDTITGIQWGEIATIPDLGDPTVKPEGWDCALAASDALPQVAPTAARTAGSGGAIAFVRSSEAGGSDLWLTDPEGQEARLTWFDDPEVEVMDPAWSPDRSHLVFASNYRAGMTETRWNLFVAAVDGSACWQVTPDASSVQVQDASALDGTVTGSFQISVAGIGAALEGATVGFPGAPALGLTAGGGAFSVDVPSGTGTLVFEGWKDDAFYRKVQDYEVEAGGTTDLGPVAANKQVPEVRLDRPVWTADSEHLIVLRTEEVADSLWSVPTDGGPWEAWYAPEAFAPRWVSPFPDGSYLALLRSDDTHEIHLVDFAAPETSVFTAFTADLDATAGGAVSPLNFIAVIMEGRPWIFGADPAGDLTSRAAGPEALTVLPDQIDWSPDNTRLVATVDSAAGPNLVILDVNDGSITTLTTDGRSSMPAWFGR